MAGLQPTSATSAPVAARVVLLAGCFLLGLAAAIFWFAFAYLTLKPQEALAAYRG